MQLLLRRRYQQLNLPKGDSTQARKQAGKIEQYLDQQERDSHCKGRTGARGEDDEPDEVKQYDAYRAFYAHMGSCRK